MAAPMAKSNMEEMNFHDYSKRRDEKGRGPSFITVGPSIPAEVKGIPVRTHTCCQEACMSCRLRYRRHITSSHLKPYDHDLGCFPHTKEVACQTEPAIPIKRSSPTPARNDTNNQPHKPQRSSQQPGLYTGNEGLPHNTSQKDKISLPASMLQEQAKKIICDRSDIDVPDSLRDDMLCLLFSSKSLSNLVDFIFSQADLKKLLWIKFLREMMASSRKACEKESSFLYHKYYQELANFSWSPVIRELVTDISLLCDVLLSYTTTRKNMHKGVHFESLIKILGFVYGCIMKARWKDLSLIQRVVSMIMKAKRSKLI